MEDQRIPKKIFKLRLHNIRLVEIPRTRQKDVFQREAFQILGTRGWRR
jgi:hypothetical protein